jgi:sec-independent protein translocase protein TatA
MKNGGYTIMFGIGMPEALVILVIILIIFGVGKLPEIGNVLGRSINSFRKATHEPDEIDVTPAAEKKTDEKKT